MNAWTRWGEEIVETWDDATQTYTDNRTGESRPFTPKEVEESVIRMADYNKNTNLNTLMAGMQAVIDAAQVRQASVQAVIDATNANINSSPASYIKELARATKRQDRAIIRLARITGGLLNSTDTGSD